LHIHPPHSLLCELVGVLRNILRCVVVSYATPIGRPCKVCHDVARFGTFLISQSISYVIGLDISLYIGVVNLHGYVMVPVLVIVNACLGGTGAETDA
jgi:hypothetical protein